MARILITLDDKPGWGVGNAKVDDFASGDEVVECVHKFRDRCGVVPMVHIVLVT